MAPSRGKGKVRGVGTPSTLAKASRSTRKPKHDTPDVYQEMLAEEARRTPETDEPERPFKRRKFATGVHTAAAKRAQSPTSTRATIGPSISLPQATLRHEAPVRPVQTIEASSDAASEDESDLAFEHVDLSRPLGDGQSSANEDDDGIENVSISVDPSHASKPRPSTRRKPASGAEKAWRLLVHKAHVLCLLGHCMYVNTWCNDINVQEHLRSLLSRKTVIYLNGKEEYSQFQRDRSFREGLEQASDAFRGHFKVTASGMKRATWSADEDEVQLHHNDESTSRLELIMATKAMEGSQDTGNQIFCALLRSVGVEARLVCTLQSLPLTSAQPKIAAQQKVTKTVIRAIPSTEVVASDSNTEDSAVKSSATIGNVPSARRRLGQPSFTPEPPAPNPERRQRMKKPIRTLDYPIFWVEAFNEAHQKWTPIDPLVTHTIGKPSKFEPPSSYALNQMSYVIAFEEDGVARDVTRRYTKAYNAKTRRQRVESTENGTQWFKKALRFFRRREGLLDRDQTEDAELNQKEVREGLPSNVQDFKDHPVYALGRHLKRLEIIEPKREVGKVNAGTAAKPRMEPVYRRSDVLVCRSADKWYRLGREVQEGQQPIKHVLTRSQRRGRSLSPDAEASEAAGASTTALYAYYQTEAYIAPPVVKGRVPRNAFGNLDMYVPSMVPPGGTHIRHALVQQAAKILRVDYADAVTGFQFKGRHGTAIIQGAVVATECAEAAEAVIDGLLDERLEEESMARSSVALRMWKRFLTGLRIKERISAYGTDGDTEDVREEIDRRVDEEEEIADAGGFFAEEPAMPTAGKFSLVEMARSAKQTPKKQGKRRKEESESEEAEISGAGSGGDEASVPVRRSKRARRRVVDEVEDVEDEGVSAGPSAARASQGEDAIGDDAGGGFLPKDMEDVQGEGGFAHDDHGSSPQDMEGDWGDGGFVPEDGGGDGHEGGGGGFVPDNVNDGNEGSGGFLPDDDAHEESGGDFVVEDNKQPDASTAPLPQAPATSPAARDDDAATSNPLDTDLNHELSEHNEDGPRSDTIINIPPAHDANVPSADHHPLMPAAPSDQPSEAVRHDAPSAERSAEASPAEGEIDRTSLAEQQHGNEADTDADRSDMGSMISHDPEDEDAEPDWLESD